MKPVRPPAVAPFLKNLFHGINMTEKIAAFQRHVPLPPTYKELKTAGKKSYATSCSDLVVRNRISVLSVFMKHIKVQDSDVIGHEFDADFDDAVQRFHDEMTNQGLAARTIQDRMELLMKWRILVTELAENGELPNDFSAALAEAIYRRKVTIKFLVKKTGIANDTLSNWIGGVRRPTRNVERQLKKLEEALRLPAGTLTKRLGFVIERHQVSRAAKEQTRTLTSYGERKGNQFKREYRLNYLIEVPQGMQSEWRQLVAHKISFSREHSCKNDTWRVKPRHAVGNKPKWPAIMPDGQVVPAADACWSYLGRYFSWLALDIKHGGAGYQIERINTLSWILNDEMMTKCLAWCQVRSGNILHAGLASILQYAAMLLRPSTGWLWLNPTLALKLDTKARASFLGFEPEGMDLGDLTIAWQARCKDVWSKYEKNADYISGHKSLQKSRSPKEPIFDILAHDRPLSIVMKMLATLKKNPPWCLQTKRFAVWTRDVLLLSWMTANPLRINHLATMTYKLDNTGHLYEANDGLWHYRCTKAEFKNSPEIFMNMPGETYDVALPKYVGDAVEEFLKEGRPMLSGANDGVYVFLPEKFANQTPTDRTGATVEVFTDRWNCEAMSTRLRVITAGLRDGKSGFGPHAFRHIVATDYLKRQPGAFKLVSELLCDKLVTVIKEYGHTSPMDGLKLHYTAAGEEFDAAMGG
jgi:transcriptional regulator with XRE-family HTH domain